MPAHTRRRLCRFDQFEADLGSGLLTRQGVRIKLQDQPFRILALLLERPGEIVSREELRRLVWGDDTHVDFDGSLNAALKRLRAALGDTSDQPRFIETVPKRGYRFLAPVTHEAPSDSAIESARASPWLGADARKSVWRISALLGIFAVVTAAVMVSRLYRQGSLGGKTTQAATKKFPMRRSLAVLSFRNVSQRPEDAWLSPALSEMMNTELAAGEALRLVAGEDVENLRLTSPSLQTESLSQSSAAQIGTVLNADLLVFGAFTSVGEHTSRQLRLDVRLQDSKSGEILQETAETGSPDNLFEMVSRVGKKMRSTLGVPALLEADELSVVASLPANSEALRFYSLGLNKLRDYDNVAAKELFEQATKADPKFSLAHSMLSRSYLLLGYRDKAKVEAKLGLDLARGLSRTQRLEVEANYYEALGDRGKGAGAYLALYSLYPDNLDYGLQLAKLQLDSYQPDESVATIHELRRLPPPARDDPRLDLREATVLFPRDAEQAHKLFRSSATKAQSQGKKLLYARALQALCFVNHEHLAAPPECQQAYEIFLGAGNREQAAACLQSMAEAQRITGHGKEAIPLYNKALAAFKQAGDHEMIGVTLLNFSLVVNTQGDWARYEELNSEALQNFQMVNDKVNESVAMGNIADVLFLRGKVRSASEMYRKAWELRESTGNKRAEYWHTQDAVVLFNQGKIPDAQQELATQIASIREYKSDPWMLALALQVQGDICTAQANLPLARQNYQEAFDSLAKANAPTAGLRISLAELTSVEGRPAEAEPQIREALAELEKDEAAGDQIDGYRALGHALLLQGKAAEAREAVHRALQLADSREFPVVRLPLQITESQALAMDKAGNSAAGERKLRAIIQEARRLQLFKIGAEARLALAQLTRKTHSGEAREELKALAAEAKERGFELIARQAALDAAK